MPHFADGPLEPKCSKSNNQVLKLQRKIMADRNGSKSVAKDPLCSIGRVGAV
jgi:hypothetical protein